MTENLALMVKDLSEGPAEANAKETPKDNITKLKPKKADHNCLFVRKGNELFKVEGKKIKNLANFYLKISSRSIQMDEDRVNDQMLDLLIYFKGAHHLLRVTAKEFQSVNIMTKIWEKVGPAAVLYGSRKDLVIATQVSSVGEIPVHRVLMSGGFNADSYYAPGLKITAGGILPLNDIEVDLSGGNFSRRIGFIHTNEADVKKAAAHIYKDFLNLKAHNVTYPLTGHIGLAPFISVISGTMGKKKYALHLGGPSGGGKTLLASLAMSFFGDFQDHFTAWTSTANAIEREGYYFRDCLFLIDDLKTSIVAPETVVRILQNYVDGHSRARMKPNATLQEPSFIRGLLLSTGEDFVENTESITGRTIVLNVDPQKNEAAGKCCLENRHLYRSFMPSLIKMVISDPEWRENFRTLVDAKTAEFHALTKNLPNGLRISSNWALNYFGFNSFVGFLKMLGIIDDDKEKAMLLEYEEIVKDHLKNQSEELTQDDPVKLMFNIIRQKLEVDQVTILNFDNTKKAKGRIVGTADHGLDVVRLHPDLIMEIISGHFRSTGQKVPFSKRSLRDALAREGLIGRFTNGHWTHQVYGESGARFNAWELSEVDFKVRCGMNDVTG